ncbi:nicotinate-nucleotide--dimethylbenzimidazole phosphoribosyltransferase [Aestuariivirga litoralis]|uniref:nicotinate-nucleotide--dimethylbenzimidazole phosphoribosyltransferase n=1 Tax=Aestuariivirga litoralis TaxID=2650924 RepID=UPI0018C513ED|nr:nicotinate-nucleotide--dimethylbenzimidazole phosphoribosyltransferase [Aestuariivirga litoralis]MBG1232288.1 nicotinate-nucleotide--dimethylbenzimidazole phosphoribosyltransferase [Aestuariivirga litoralis]
MTTGLPFDDIRHLIASMPGPDEQAEAQAKAHDAILTKPPGALGKLEMIAEFMARWQHHYPPRADRTVVAVFAGNHGVVKQGVAAYPPEVTMQMVANFQGGGAAVNQICKAYDLGLKVFELALEQPTGDITQDAALSEKDCAATIAYGMEAIAGGCDLLCVGEMGIGNTTIASALACALFGGKGADWVGIGTGVDAAGLKRKADAVDRAMAFHQGHLSDPLEVLRRVGGREFAAMAGAILAGRMQNVPVIVDGFVASAAAAVLYKADKSALDHCLFGHCSAENAHRKLLAAMGKEPLLDLGMRLGEASGAAMAAGVVKAALACHNGMATFESAGVSNKD